MINKCAKMAASQSEVEEPRESEGLIPSPCIFLLFNCLILFNNLETDSPRWEEHTGNRFILNAGIYFSKHSVYYIVPIPVTNSVSFPVNHWDNADLRFSAIPFGKWLVN